MPTIIDSLVVELGLDPTKWKEGQAEADRSVAKTREAAQRGATEWEALAKKGDDFLRTLQTQALKLASIFLGGLGVEKVLSSFANVDAAAGRTARYLKMPVDVLSQWENAARTVGAAEGEITQSFQNLQSALTQFQMGLPAPAIGVLRALLPGVNPLGMSPDQIFQMIAERRAGMDPARLAEFMNMIGAGRAGLDLVSLGPQGLGQRLEDARRVGVLTKEMAEHAAAMQKAWAEMVLSATQIGRIMADMASGPLIQAFNAMRDFLIWFQGEQSRTLADRLGTGPSGSPFTGDFWRAKPGELTVKDALGFLHWAVSGGHEPAAAGGGAAPNVGGGGGGTRGNRNNNRGNIKYGTFAALHGAIGQDERGFAIFPDVATGDAAQQALIQTNYRGLTLDQFGNKYSEGSEAWKNTVGGMLGIGRGSIVDVNNPRLFEAIRVAEGTSRGGARGGGNSVNINSVNVTSTAADLSGVAADTFTGVFRDAAVAAMANSGMQ